MPSLKKIKFSKLDKYGSIVFIATKLLDPDNFTKIGGYNDKLIAKNYDTFLPTFVHNEHDYATLRCFKSTKYKLDIGFMYDIDFDVKVKSKNGKMYVNIYLNKCIQSGKPKVFDEGTVIDLD